MVFIGGNKRQVKNELLEIICLSLEKFLTSIPFHKVGKNIKDFLLWFASPKTFPKIPKTILWPWPQLVAIYTPLYAVIPNFNFAFQSALIWSFQRGMLLLPSSTALEMAAGQS